MPCSDNIALPGIKNYYEKTYLLKRLRIQSFIQKTVQENQFESEFYTKILK